MLIALLIIIAVLLFFLAWPNILALVVILIQEYKQGEIDRILAAEERKSLELKFENERRERKEKWKKSPVRKILWAFVILFLSIYFLGAMGLLSWLIISQQTGP